MECFKSVTFFLLFFVFNSAVDVDLPFLKQCKLEDSTCSKNLWQEAVPYLAKGVPELDMPPLDPLKMQNIKITAPNLFEVNFIEGVMKGYKTCITDDFKWKTIKKGKIGAEIDLHCNITIKGRYNATASSGIIPGIASDETLNADGDMKIKLMNLKLKFIFDFKIQKNEDGDVILLLKTPIKYKYETNGPVILRANKIFLGKQDISELAVNLMNAAWRPLVDNYSGPFFKKAMDLIGNVQKSFFKGVPTSKYTAEDMSQYVE